VNLYEEACKVMPGGVSSPVRAFKAVGGEPIFIKKGSGSKIYDVNDNEYIDYVMSYGPLILGHADKNVIKSIIETAKNGTTFGAPTELEISLAKLIIRLMPSIEMLRFVNSGTEAVMSAIRLARAFTKRNKIIKFEGCYHGHSDFLLVSAGSGLASLNIPSTPGVVDTAIKDTLIASYNSIDSVFNVAKSQENDIAAIIVEPVAGNMGVVLPEENFLNELREYCNKIRALLIFDEVISGFRVARGGAQEIYDVKPDLTILGKIIGGGLPVGAFGGRRDIMEMLAPIGSVYQAGTLSGNPIAMAAGIATLLHLQEEGFYERLADITAKLFEGFKDNLRSIGFNFPINYTTGLGTQFFCDGSINKYSDLKDVDTQLYAKFFHFMLDRGIYLPPSQFEALFISTAHTMEDIDTTLRAHMEFLVEYKKNAK
jgi:glutamate-1-semialdehyde 2,1-aminomutase